MPFGPSHPVLRKVARWTMDGFFSRIEVEGSENVPQEGPVIVCCTHWNMIVDPAILSCYFPHNRMLHYWAKSTIFINKPVSALLKDAGNIPVDRTNKDNQALFAGTFDVLKQGEVVAIFPEGTSYTEPRMQGIKEGASWAALEYAKNIRTVDPQSSGKQGAKDAKLVVASIVYTNKTKYRQRAVMTFNTPIDTAPYIDDFMTGDPKAAVKRLTAAVRGQMEGLTINAPDWDTLRAAETARELLWGDDAHVPLSHWQHITQSLVDLFSPASASSSSSASPLSSQTASAKDALVAYEAHLRTYHFTNSSLNALPLPKILDPLHSSAPTHARLSSLWALTKATLSSLVLLPFFVLPLLTHLPIYALGRATQLYLNAGEPEAFAQNKIVFSLLALVVVIYPAVFFTTWALFLFTPLGLVIALGWTAAFAVYHNRLVDGNYAGWKKLVAAWRVLLGIWTGPASAERNSTRRMLKLRADAADKTASLLLELEKADKPLEVQGMDDGQSGRQVKQDIVDEFRRMGARIGRGSREGQRNGGSLAGESDSQGRLKQS